ncbi:MAG: DNA primase large subunit PriL [Candidatus Diapherotrites archaeon]|nr:DNA primase large subunit PriL [Candidatus Diapherotrites archaeon]
MFTRGELQFSVKYPFSSATKGLAKWINFDFSSVEPRLLDRAKQRAIEGIETGRTTVETNTSSERIMIAEILSYPLAKIIVGKTRDKFLISRYARAEARAFQKFLLHESPANLGALARDFGFSISDAVIPFTDYLKYLPREEEYKLVNAPLKDGQVQVDNESIAHLLPEKLRDQIEKDLYQPMDVPTVFDTYAAEVAKETNRDKAFKITEEFGKVEAGIFPPCIKLLIQEAESGQPMAHQPRFVLATFLVNVGMPVEQVTELFRNTPNFNEKKTRYYIEYSLGKRGSGTKYSPPSCEKMVFYGLCRNKDALCERVKHPLKYYSKKKEVKPNA